MNTFVFFCIILSIGGLETVSNEDYVWQRARDAGVEGNILPVQRYFNGQGNHDAVHTRMPLKSCLKQFSSQEAQLEQSIIPSPSRRSSNLKSERNNFVNFESTSQPVSRYENDKSSVTENEQHVNPSLFNAENDSSENQVPLEENSSTSNENLVEDNIIEVTPPVPESITPVNKMLSNQEIVGSEESTKPNLVVSKHQIMPTPGSRESPLHQTECSGKNKIDDLTPRRFLETLNYDVPSQQKKTLDRNSSPLTNNNKAVNSQINNNLVTNNNNMNSQNPDVSTSNDKSTAIQRDFYKGKNIEQPIQETNEKIPGRAGSIHYTHTSNSYTKARDPTKGEGISYMNKNTRINLMDFERVCYACSTANNPTCWLPDRKTTVKYCRKRDNACVTKTFGSGSTFVLTRDCGNTCNEAKMPGLSPKYQTCSICHTDLCNGTHSINVYSSMLVLPTIVLIILIKPLIVSS